MKFTLSASRIYVRSKGYFPRIITRYFLNKREQITEPQLCSSIVDNRLLKRLPITNSESCFVVLGGPAALKITRLWILQRSDWLINLRCKTLFCSGVPKVGRLQKMRAFVENNTDWPVPRQSTYSLEVRWAWVSVYTQHFRRLGLISYLVLYCTSHW